MHKFCIASGECIYPFSPCLRGLYGIIRGVDIQITPQEVLEQFSIAGVTSVYHCWRAVENKGVPAESVAAPFVGITCPTEIKVWPLIYQVKPLPLRSLWGQCCWRFGHTFKACKSSPWCHVCGESHSAGLCKVKMPNVVYVDGDVQRTPQISLLVLKKSKN